MGYQLPLPTLTATPTPIPTQLSTEAPAPLATQVQTPTPPAPEPIQMPAPSAGPVTRIKIPRLNINRGVIPVGLKNQGRQLQWDTDVLFATGNRADLVGQPLTSVNPGDGGNIVLIGHNYNNGWNSWGAVFVNLKSLRPGDVIILHTKNGGEYQYTVQRVKKVPWQRKNASELEKHQKFMWPTESERLTLVTCGGTNLLSWSARIYVVAVPAAP
jgi:LPXTG-site transpeptidase (sortase) family protein